MPAPAEFSEKKSGNESIYTEKATNVRQQSGQQKEENWQGAAKQEKGEKAEKLCFRFVLLPVCTIFEATIF